MRQITEMEKMLLQSELRHCRDMIETLIFDPEKGYCDNLEELRSLTLDDIDGVTALDVYSGIVTWCCGITSESEA